MSDSGRLNPQLGQTWDETFGPNYKPKNCGQGDSELRAAYRKWFASFGWHFHITTQVAGYSIDDDEVRQRLRQVDYQINRTYLPSRFSKFQHEDRFWHIGFFEGKGEDRHCHTVWYVPFHKIKQYVDYSTPEKKEFLLERIKSDINLNWCCLNSLNPSNGLQRNTKPLFIQKLHSQSDSSNVAYYDSKNFDPLSSGEDFFISNS